tara:strand:+ start:210 stop:587 length:378 start_codon:yes stop_codon:yes gene_type:complete
MSSDSLPANVLLFPGAPLPEVEPAPVASLQAFAAHVQARELLDAADCLAVLLGLEEERAYHCTLHFLARYRRERNRALGRLARLRIEAQEENVDRMVELLADCFGLVGPEAAGLLAPLRDEVSIA